MENDYIFFLSGDSNDTVVVNGYINSICKKYGMNYLSYDIIDILSSYYCNEMLHCVHSVTEFERLVGKDSRWWVHHYVVPTSIVLPSKKRKFMFSR